VQGWYGRLRTGQLLQDLSGNLPYLEWRACKRKRPSSELQQPVSRKPRRKLRKWADNEMRRAIEYAQSGTVNINEAVRCYKIPPTTLKDRLSGRVVHGPKMGAKPYLTHEEEKELVEFLINCVKMGYGKTRKEVLNMVHTTVEKK